VGYGAKLDALESDSSNATVEMYIYGTPDDAHIWTWNCLGSGLEWLLVTTVARTTDFACSVMMWFCKRWA